MKWLKPSFLLLAGLLIYSHSIAQQLELEVKEVNEMNHPKYSGNLVVRDPAGIQSSQVRMFEGDTELTTVMMPGAPSQDIYAGKEVLFLVLNHQAYDNRTKWYQSVINQAIDDGILGANDAYAVQSFDCNRPEYGSDKQLLFPAKPTFVTTEAALRNQVSAIDLSKPKFKNNCQTNSNIYGALSVALEQFGNAPQSSGKMRAIVLLADDWSIVSEIKIQGIIERSKELDIPIYGVTFYQNIQRQYGVEPICEATYGGYSIFQENEAAEASAALLKYCKNMTQRASGITYPFTFETTHPKDGKSHQVKVTYNKKTTSFQYQVPEQTFGDWFEANFWLCIGLIVAVLAALIVLLVMRSKKKKRAEEAELKRQEELRRVEEQQSAADLKVARQEEELKRIKDDEKRKLDQERAERIRKEKEADNAAKVKEMGARGNLPWFTYRYGDQTGSFELNHSEFTVGRDEENNYRINLSIVSRRHFEVVYAEGTYVITDLNSSNGTYLNGQRITSSQLKDGDVISLGDVHLTFHI